MNSTPLLPSDVQLDALREVANIGCGHAANALARLVGNRKVDLSLPRVVVAAAHDAGDALGGDEPVVAAKLGLVGELRGRMLFVLPPKDGSALEWLLLRGQGGVVERESAVSEAANIVASACLSAVGKLTGWKLLTTVPVLQRGPGREIVAGAVAETEGESSPEVVLEARFASTGTPVVSGQMLLVLERGSAWRLLQRLGL
ncbi:chemotaxis protein CheC [Myxococcaceae bacterium GXIMD 01537]